MQKTKVNKIFRDDETEADRSPSRIGHICLSWIRCGLSEDDLIKEMVDEIHLCRGGPMRPIDSTVKIRVGHVEGCFPYVCKFCELKVNAMNRSERKYILPSMRYGTEVKSAPVSRKVSRRVLALINELSVGHPETGKDAEGGEYERDLRPALWNTVSKSDGANPSEFTMSNVTTI
jgi:hypothetical protein